VREVDWRGFPRAFGVGVGIWVGGMEGSVLGWENEGGWVFCEFGWLFLWRVGFCCGGFGGGVMEREREALFWGVGGRKGFLIGVGRGVEGRGVGVCSEE
jgi:hypothetical protein